MTPGTWFKHYTCENGAVPTYLWYVGRVGDAFMVQLVSGKQLTVNARFMHWLEPIEDEHPVIVQRRTFERPENKPLTNGKRAPDQAAAAVATADQGLWPRLFGKANTWI